MDFHWDNAIIWTSLPVLWRGVIVTAELWIIAFPLGMLIGALFSLGRTSGNSLLNGLSIVWVEVFRNTPVLIQLIWFYYALPILTHIQLSPIQASLLALALNTSAYCCEIYRSGIQSVAVGQWEGAKAIGMRKSQILRRIIFPQVFKRMLPAFTNRGIEMAKMTSLCSILSVQEIMYQGRLLSSAFYRPLEIFTCVALIYFVVIYPLSLCSSQLERRYGRSD